jgi:hypothetical protein
MAKITALVSAEWLGVWTMSPGWPKSCSAKRLSCVMSKASAEPDTVTT